MTDSRGRNRRTDFPVAVRGTPALASEVDTWKWGMGDELLILWRECSTAGKVVVLDQGTLTIDIIAVIDASRRLCQFGRCEQGLASESASCHSQNRRSNSRLRLC